jgi:hypothetical protein
MHGQITVWDRPEQQSNAGGFEAPQRVLHIPLGSQLHTHQRSNAFIDGENRWAA